MSSYIKKAFRSACSLMLCALLLSSAVIVALPDTALAATTKSYKGVVQKNPTKVFSKKSGKSKVVRKIAAGNVISVKYSSGTWCSYAYTVKGKKKTGYIKKSQVSFMASGSKYSAFSTAKSASVYAKASASTKKVKTLSGGTLISVTPYTSSWVKYTYKSGGKTKTGYVQKKYLERKSSNGSFAGIVLTKSKTYKRPSTYAPAAKTLGSGTTLTFERYSANWYRFVYTEGGTKKAAFIRKSTVGIAGETTYNLTLTQALDAQCQGARSSLNGRYPNSAKNPLTRTEVKKYLDPKNYGNDSYEYLQFLVLNTFDGVTGAQLNKTVLSTCTGSSSLKNKGDAFVASAKKYNINAVYLASHARLESGSGMSNLSMGVYYSSKENNALTRAQFADAKNGIKPPSPKKMPVDFSSYQLYYNHFGYGAADSDPLRGGARWAASKGWTTSEKAIDGCAQTISANYFNARNQTTLYKMRWNPAAMVTYKSTKGIGYQYATDISWACKIANIMGAAYSTIGLSNSYVDVPVYK